MMPQQALSLQITFHTLPDVLLVAMALICVATYGMGRFAPDVSASRGEQHSANFGHAGAP